MDAWYHDWIFLRILDSDPVFLKKIFFFLSHILLYSVITAEKFDTYTGSGLKILVRSGWKVILFTVPTGLHPWEWKYTGSHPHGNTHTKLHPTGYWTYRGLNTYGIEHARDWTSTWLNPHRIKPARDCTTPTRNCTCTGLHQHGIAPARDWTHTVLHPHGIAPAYNVIGMYKKSWGELKIIRKSKGYIKSCWGVKIIVNFKINK